MEVEGSGRLSTLFFFALTGSLLIPHTFFSVRILLLMPSGQNSGGQLSLALVTLASRVISLGEPLVSVGALVLPSLRGDQNRVESFEYYDSHSRRKGVAKNEESVRLCYAYEQ